MKKFLTSLSLLLFIPYSLWAERCPSHFTVRDIAKALIELEILRGDTNNNYEVLEKYLYFTHETNEENEEGEVYLVQHIYNHTIISIDKLDEYKYRVNYKMDALKNGKQVDAKFNIVFKLHRDLSKGCIESVEKKTNIPLREKDFYYMQMNAG